MICGSHGSLQETNLEPGAQKARIHGSGTLVYWIPVYDVMPVAVVNSGDDLLEEPPGLVLLQLPVLHDVLKQLTAWRWRQGCILLHQTSLYMPILKIFPNYLRQNNHPFFQFSTPYFPCLFSYLSLLFFPLSSFLHFSILLLKTFPKGARREGNTEFYTPLGWDKRLTMGPWLDIVESLKIVLFGERLICITLNLVID